jgi:hypothetical protein
MILLSTGILTMERMMRTGGGIVSARLSERRVTGKGETHTDGDDATSLV